jgi:hypothetical protein
MPSLNQVLGRAAVGGAIGLIAGVVLSLLLYTVFFQGGYQTMQDPVDPMRSQMIPIYIVLGSIGVMLGALAGAGSLLVQKGNSSEPPSRR